MRRSQRVKGKASKRDRKFKEIDRG